MYDEITAELGVEPILGDPTRVVYVGVVDAYGTNRELVLCVETAGELAAALEAAA